MATPVFFNWNFGLVLGGFDRQNSGRHLGSVGTPMDSLDRFLGGFFHGFSCQNNIRKTLSSFNTYGRFLKWWYPQTPQMIFFCRKTNSCWVPPF